MKIIVMGLTIALISLLSCRADIVEPAAFEQRSYPLHVGNWWRYNVTNLNKQTSNTLLLKIVSEQTNNSVTTYRCELEQNGRIVDSAQMILAQSELIYKALGSDRSFFGDFKLKLPFHNGDTWEGNSLSDKIEVISFLPNYAFLGENYDVYNIKRNVPGFNYYFSQTLQIAKGVGIVSQYIDSFDSFSIEKYLFELIEYKVHF
jgi:hypothetical protein